MPRHHSLCAQAQCNTKWSTKCMTQHSINNTPHLVSPALYCRGWRLPLCLKSLRPSRSISSWCPCGQQRMRKGIPSKREKRFFNVNVGFGTRFNEGDSKLLSERSALIFRNNALFIPVTFISDKNFVDSLCCMLFDILEPGADVYCQLTIKGVSNYWMIAHHRHHTPKEFPSHHGNKLQVNTCILQDIPVVIVRNRSCPGY